MIQDCFWLLWHGPFQDTGAEIKANDGGLVAYRNVFREVNKVRQKLPCIYLNLNRICLPFTSLLYLLISSTSAARRRGSCQPLPPPQPVQHGDVRMKTFMIIHLHLLSNKWSYCTMNKLTVSTSCIFMCRNYVRLCVVIVIMAKVFSLCRTSSTRYIWEWIAYLTQARWVMSYI